MVCSPEKSWEVAGIKLWVLICLKPTVLEPLDHHWSSIFVVWKEKQKQRFKTRNFSLLSNFWSVSFKNRKSIFFDLTKLNFLSFLRLRVLPSKKYHSHSKKLSYDEIQNTQMTRVPSAKNEAFISKYRGNSFLVALLLTIWMAWTDKTTFLRPTRSHLSQKYRVIEICLHLSWLITYNHGRNPRAS